MGYIRTSAFLRITFIIALAIVACGCGKSIHPAGSSSNLYVRVETEIPDYQKDMSPLMRAAITGDAVEIDRLISQGADVNENNSDPLYAASLNGNDKAVIALLGHGANVNAVSEGSTALWQAANSSHTKTAEILVQRGANIEAGNSDGETPLLAAASRANEALVNFLLDHGANVKAKDNFGMNALHKCSLSGSQEENASEDTSRAEIAKALIEKGADVNAIAKVAKGRDRETPLSIALACDHEEVALVLQEHGGVVPLPQ